jgi:hypothetical protein
LTVTVELESRGSWGSPFTLVQQHKQFFENFLNSDATWLSGTKESQSYFLPPVVFVLQTAQSTWFFQHPLLGGWPLYCFSGCRSSSIGHRIVVVGHRHSGRRNTFAGRYYLLKKKKPEKHLSWETTTVGHRDVDRRPCHSDNVSLLPTVICLTRGKLKQFSWTTSSINKLIIRTSSSFYK